jgi:hypothetical protein
MKTRNRLSIIFLVTALTLSGCAAIPLIVKIADAIMQNTIVIDEIQNFVDMWFAQRPDANGQRIANDVIQSTRLALEGLIQIARGAKDVSDKDYVAALDKFEKAWADMLQILDKYGVKEQSKGLYSARAGGHLLVAKPNFPRAR